MKRSVQLLILTLALALSLCLLPLFSAEANAYEYGGYCGDNLSWKYNTSSRTLSIYGSGDMYNYDYGDAPWSWYIDLRDVKAISIQSGVTGLGSYCFSDCENVTAVTIPAGVKRIGQGAFVLCKRLASVTIPNTVTEIGVDAFYGCAALSSLQLPPSLKLLSAGMFYQCTGLKSITIPASVTEIGQKAFYQCTALTSVVIPNAVTNVGAYAFQKCTALTSLTVGSGVKTIEKYAFDGCANLKYIHISDLAAWCKISFGLWANPLRNETAGLFVNGMSTKNLVIPNGVTSIGAYAFEGYSGLVSVTIPGSVTTVGGYAFSLCKNLTDVTIGTGVKEICGGVFSNCSSLISLSFPNSVTGIGDYAFFGCDGLKNLYIPATAAADFHTFDGWNSGHILYGGTASQWNAMHATSKYSVHYSAKGNEVQWIVDETNDRLYCSLCGKDLAYRAPVCNFTDVHSGAYFYTPVRWAVQKNITTGTTATTFSPNDPCTRVQIVTFLWRAAGAPEPKSTVNPFTDVSENLYYYKAVLWAVERGITNGISATEFGPNLTCTRAQAATFLWRLCGKPTPRSSSNPFSDVSNGAYYYEPILWAVENGITNGTGGGKFSPEDSCTRGQIVTFLYRALAK